MRLRNMQVLEVHWKGNQLWGSIEVLPTPAGLLLWELYSQVRCPSSAMRVCHGRLALQQRAGVSSHIQRLWPRVCHRILPGGPEVASGATASLVRVRHNSYQHLTTMFIAQGIKLGVSSRGWASLLQDPARDCVLVDQDFELITFDFVTEPSTKDAYLVPLQRTFPPQNLPNQKKVVQLAHLGHGVCSMDRISKLPPSSQVAARIADYRAQVCGKHWSTLDVVLSAKMLL